jgi:hypothetical protein
MKFRLLCLVALALGACAGGRSPRAGAPVSTTAIPQACIDRDRDGFGDHCSGGNDCDDHDPAIHSGCLRCAVPSDGCSCANGTEPVQCFLDKTKATDGTVMCNEGTRYCREGKWSGCESVFSYPLPEHAPKTALINPDAGPVQCNDCNVVCYRITDNLDPVDGGLASNNSTSVSWVPGGGLTLAVVPDAGTADAGPGSIVSSTPPACTLGVGPDLDCDGIPNQYDPYPNTPPFATANPSIFLQVGPGETGIGQIDLSFFVNSADVYFLVDQTGSMAEERDQIKHDLTTGDFVNDAAYQCADYDFDRQPNNELKTQGIIGAIKCKIRDANFGAGFFREIPFSGYAPDDQIAFANYQDVTNNVSSVLAAINRFTTIGNNDWPEASMVGLHNVLTGNGMNFGTTKRSIPPRRNCPGSTWGYPCFRQDAIPVVVMFTDAEFHNGPDTNTYAYNPSSFSITASSDNQDNPLPVDNENFNSAASLGDLTSSYKTFSGDTTNMNADLTASLIGSSCLTSGAGNDALVRFDLTQQKTVTIETTGSQFDTVLGLFTGVPGSPTDLPASTNGNETGASALSLGQAHNNYLRIAGNTSAMHPEYQWSDVGSCGAATDSPDAVFSFDVSSTTQVAIDTSGSAFDTVVGLYSAAPTLPPSYTAVANTNDNYSSAYLVGDVFGQIKAFSGDTSTPSLGADYAASQVGCNAADAAKDVVYSFTLSSPTRVRLSTEGSSFDTVLGLYDNGSSPVGSAAVPSTNELMSSAYAAGTVDAHIFNLAGTTAGMRADYSGVGCSANDAAPDAVFKYHLNATTDVQIDTIGTTWDTVLGLYDQAFDVTNYLTAVHTNEVWASSTDLGSLNNRDVRVSGGTTSGMASDYGTSNVSCGGWGRWYSPDAVYKFHLDNDTRVQIDLDGSSYDTLLQLQSGPAADVVAAISSNTNDTGASPFVVGTINNKSLQWNADDSSLSHDYNVACGSDALAKDAVFQFSITKSTQIQLDTMGTSWDTVLGLYPATITADPAPTDVGSSNSTQGSAYDIGTLNGQHYEYKGTTVGAGHEWIDNHCSTATNAEDSYFKFTLTSAANVTISTAGSASPAVILLYGGPPGPSTYQGCNSTSLTMTALAAGTYYIVVKGTSVCGHGTYQLDIKDSTAVVSNQVICDDDTGGNHTSKIVATLAPGTYNLVVTGRAVSDSGAYSVRFRDLTWWTNLGEEACSDDISTSNHSSRVEKDLVGGNYWFIIKGGGWGSAGAYALRVLDVGHPPVGPSALACDDNSGGGTQSKITRLAQPPGDYYVTLKGHAATDSGTYKLNIKDLSATASGAIIQCDDNSGDNPRSLIERDLAVGTYHVIVKGRAATDQGAYKLQIRDVTSKPYSILGCDNDGGPSMTSYLERSLDAGTYYVALKGHTANASGAYSLAVRDVTNRPIISTACNDTGSTYNTSKITQTLNAGTYYVAVKGKDANAKGQYQISVGGGTSHAGTYTPPTWATTLAAIQSTQAHVISILSCHDDPSYGDNGFNKDCVHTRAQAVSLANASNALGANLQPLVFDIDSNGTGLSTAVVNAVSQLAKYLEMDVTVRVLFDPDPNPGFIVKVKAIDQAGDGCDGLVGLTHQKCAPGATPRFQISFENPPGAPVALNPNDPKGGYSFRAELIGDNQFIVDKVPIYIIPTPGPMGPPTPTQYYTQGTYWQDTGSPGCKGNQAPDWRDLSWNAEVYANTSVTFSACTAQTTAALASCTPHEIASITGTGTCTTTADCPSGYCDTSVHVCQVATAGTCANSTQCASNAFCDMTMGKCVFNGQPVYIGAVLAAENFNSYIRMKIDLHGTPPFTSPPVVHSWDMTYLCTQAL